MPAHLPTISADEALRRLIDGNERFLNGITRWDRVTVAALTTLADGQRPYATILGCSDSRVPPELVFDAGFGELFIVRVAGNVISAEILGTLQYAGMHLQTPLFVVMGHRGCGAVGAALKTKEHGASHPSRIAFLLQTIYPAFADIDFTLPPAELFDAAVEANVRWSMRQLLETPEARQRAKEGVMKLVGAVYDLETGRVRFLS